MTEKTIDICNMVVWLENHSAKIAQDLTDHRVKLTNLIGNDRELNADVVRYLKHKRKEK